MNSPARCSLMSLLRASSRMVALLTLTVLTALFISVNCHAVGPKGDGLHVATAVPLPASEHTAPPCCPVDDHDHADVDHCASCLHCAGNALLAGYETFLSYAPAISSLNPVDRFNHLPEVYLPIFIPPQNLS